MEIGNPDESLGRKATGAEAHWGQTPMWST